MLTSTTKTAPTSGSVTAGASAIALHWIVALSSQVAPIPLTPLGPFAPPRRQRTLWGTTKKGAVSAFVHACVHACAHACVTHLGRDEAATVHDELSWLIAGGGERAHIDHLWQMLAGDLREGHCEAD